MIVDVNTYTSRWPFRRLPGDQPAAFASKLKTLGVEEAWVGSFDGLLHKDVDGVNRRLIDTCQHEKSARLVPFGTVNLTLPDWREDLRRCAQQYRMPGIRLHPNYHGYTLDDPRFAELLALAERSKLIVQVAVRMEDVRTQHPLLRVADVDTNPLPGILSAHPKLRVVILNGLQTVHGTALTRLVTAGSVYLEIATLEGISGIARLLEQIPVDRLLFGSHFPLFILESALLKLREAALTAAQLAAITRDNARRLQRRG